MEVRHLRYFTELYRRKSFTKTAEQLFISQSALSQQISQLEGELGVCLFSRDRRGVAPTPAADALYPYAEAALDSVQRFLSQANQFAQEQKRSLKIIIHNKLKVTRLVALLGEFIASHPDITLDIIDMVFPSAESVSPQIIKQGDVVFVREMYCANVKAAPNCVCQRIAEQSLYAVFSRSCPLAQQTQVRFSDFQARHMQMLSGQRGGLLDRMFTDMGVGDTDTASIYTDDYDILANLLQTGQYWAQSTRAFARYYDLACLPLAGQHRSDGICMLYSSDNSRKAQIEHLRTFIMEHDAELEQ